MVKNKHGEKANHVRLSMKDENAPKTEGIEPSFFRKPSSRQEGRKLHLECEIEALPRPEVFWFLGEKQISDSDKYSLFRAIQPSNPNIHFVRLTINVSSSPNLNQGIPSSYNSTENIADRSPARRTAATTW